MAMSFGPEDDEHLEDYRESQDELSETEYEHSNLLDEYTDY